MSENTRRLSSTRRLPRPKTYTHGATNTSGDKRIDPESERTCFVCNPPNILASRKGLKAHQARQCCTSRIGDDDKDKSNDNHIGGMSMQRTPPKSQQKSPYTLRSSTKKYAKRSSIDGCHTEPTTVSFTLETLAESNMSDEDPEAVSAAAAIAITNVENVNGMLKSGGEPDKEKESEARAAVGDDGGKQESTVHQNLVLEDGSGQNERKERSGDTTEDNRMDKMDAKIDKLIGLATENHNNIGATRGEIGDLTRRLDTLHSENGLLKSCQEEIKEDTRILKESVDENFTQILRRIRIIEDSDKVSYYQTEAQAQASSMSLYQDMERRARNLVMTGVKEAPEETEHTVRDVATNALDMVLKTKDAADHLEKAHRVGAVNNKRTSPRTIILVFISVTSRDIFWDRFQPIRARIKAEWDHYNSLSQEERRVRGTPQFITVRPDTPHHLRKRGFEYKDVAKVANIYRNMAPGNGKFGVVMVGNGDMRLLYFERDQNNKIVELMSKQEAEADALKVLIKAADLKGWRVKGGLASSKVGEWLPHPTPPEITAQMMPAFLSSDVTPYREDSDRYQQREGLGVFSRRQAGADLRDTIGRDLMQMAGQGGHLDYFRAAENRLHAAETMAEDKLNHLAAIRQGSALVDPREGVREVVKKKSY